MQPHAVPTIRRGVRITRPDDWKHWGHVKFCTSVATVHLREVYSLRPREPTGGGMEIKENDRPSEAARLNLSPCLPHHPVCPITICWRIRSKSVTWLNL